MNELTKRRLRKSSSVFAGEDLIATLFVLIGFYWMALTIDTKTWVDAANLYGPLALGLAAAWAFYRLMRRCPEALWTPYVWFLVGIMLFYAMGPLVYMLATPDTLDFVNSFLTITPIELLRTNLLNAVGVLAVLLGFWVGQALWPGSGRRVPGALVAPAVSAKTLAFMFLAAGGALQYLFILPHWFGMLDFVLPGVVRNLSSLYVLGLTVLAYYVACGARSWRVPLLVLWGLQVIVSILLFSKEELVMALILPALGAFLANRSISRLFLWAMLVALIFFSMQPLVQYGRISIQNQTGTIYRATLVERVRIVEDWFEKGMPGKQVSASESAWARLNYAHVQAYAMARYDNGSPGDTLRHAGIVLVPRLIWPEKPIISNKGSDFYNLVTEQRGSSLGLGIFGEGYWNFGWVGVLGLGLALGAIYAVLSTIVLGWIRRRAFEYLPSIMLGIKMGVLGTTEVFVMGVIGPTGILAVYALFISYLVRLIAMQPKHKSRAVPLTSNKDSVTARSARQRHKSKLG